MPRFCRQVRPDGQLMTVVMVVGAGLMVYRNRHSWVSWDMVYSGVVDDDGAFVGADLDFTFSSVIFFSARAIAWGRSVFLRIVRMWSAGVFWLFPCGRGRVCSLLRIRRRV